MDSSSRLLTLAFIAALLLPLAVRSPFALHVLVLLGIWVVLSESLNFVTGFAGQLALGHAAFVTIGGYVGSLLMIHRGWSFWAAILLGGGSAFISGLVLGVIIRLLAVNLVSITRGPMGLPGIPRPVIFGYKFSGQLPYYYLILALIALTHISIERMLFSRFGRACLAIRDDEVAAEAMGVRSYTYKVLAFCISSGYAGLVGVFYASWATLFSPDSFKLDDSIMMSVMITLGGIGSLLGPIPGALGIGALPELLRPFTTGARIASLRLAGVGLVMVVFLILRPQGIAGMSTEKIYISLDPIRKLLIRRGDSEPGEGSP